MTERAVWENLVNEFREAKLDLEVQRDPQTDRIKKARSYACPLDSYERRDLITPEQHSAGLDFAQLFRTGFCRSQSVQSSYEVRAAGRGSNQVFNDAAWRYLKAYQCIRGEREREMAVRVCCHDLPYGRGNLPVLTSALDDLSRHFRRKSNRR